MRLFFGRIIIFVAMFILPMVAQAEESAPAVANLARPSIVTVYAANSSGSGFFVSAQGHILTNAHVVGNNKSVTVVMQDGKRKIAKVLGRGQQDVALLLMDAENVPSLKIGEGHTAQVGESLVWFGAPKGLKDTVSRGSLANNRRMIDGERYLQLDGYVNPGNSGGPVLNMRGEVIGIVTLKDKRADGIGYALPIEASGKLLQEHRVLTNTDKRTSSAPSPLPAEQEDTGKAGKGIATAIATLCIGAGLLYIIVKRKCHDVPQYNKLPQMTSARCEKCGELSVDPGAFCMICGARMPIVERIAGSATMKYAGFWVRVMAHLIDNFLVSTVSYTIAAVCGAVNMDESLFSAVIMIILVPVYYAGMEASSRQATLGKQALGLIVIDDMGKRLTVGKAFKRWLCKILSGLLLGFGFLMVGFTKHKQGLHDSIMGTYVVYSNFENKSKH